MSATIGGSNVEEREDLKTLGVLFDNGITFKRHWQVTVKSCWSKLFAISHLKRYLNLERKRQLGQGLVISMILYCIEATSTRAKTTLLAPTKVYNRLARTVTGEWRQE